MDRFDELLMARARAWYPQAEIEHIGRHQLRITHGPDDVESVDIAPIAWEFADAPGEVVVERIDRHLNMVKAASQSDFEAPP